MHQKEFDLQLLVGWILAGSLWAQREVVLEELSQWVVWSQGDKQVGIRDLKSIDVGFISHFYLCVIRKLAYPPILNTSIIIYQQ